ncbi:hypothetical protein CRUP_000394 [Coryphaenoides rupestris]|nr:hypothetical protein CRUP_000394 [Coryphaenoides rupestris]
MRQNKQQNSISQSVSSSPCVSVVAAAAVHRVPLAGFVYFFKDGFQYKYDPEVKYVISRRPAGHRGHLLGDEHQHLGQRRSRSSSDSSKSRGPAAAAAASSLLPAAPAAAKGLATAITPPPGTRSVRKKPSSLPPTMAMWMTSPGAVWEGPMRKTLVGTRMLVGNFARTTMSSVFIPFSYSKKPEKERNVDVGGGCARTAKESHDRATSQPRYSTTHACAPTLMIECLSYTIMQT